MPWIDKNEVAGCLMYKAGCGGHDEQDCTMPLPPGGFMSFRGINPLEVLQFQYFFYPFFFWVAWSKGSHDYILVRVHLPSLSLYYVEKKYRLPWEFCIYVGFCVYGFVILYFWAFLFVCYFFIIIILGFYICLSFSFSL